MDGLPIELILSIAARHGAKAVRVFGSRARGDARPDSDLDLLIEPKEGTSIFDLIRLEKELEETLDLPVEVVTLGGLRPGVRDMILKEAKQLVA